MMVDPHWQLILKCYYNYNHMPNKKIKILVVDDDDLTRETYADVFRKANFEVLEAIDGVDGLDSASKNLPDVIFTGIIMPRMDGFTMVETLKKTVLTASIPIVFISHMGREEDQQRAKQLGAKDFIIRDLTPPGKVVQRVEAIFTQAAGSYLVDFSPYAFDAPKLANDVGIEGFKCEKCNEKMILQLKVVNANEKTFEAAFVCPKCDIAK